MPLYVLGPVLMLAGIVFIAAREIYAGRLSNAKRGVGSAPPSLEPRRQGSLFSPTRNWPGLLLILLGALLLLLAAIS